MKIVNVTGWFEIEQFLLENHVDGHKIAGRVEKMRPFVRSAEWLMQNGGRPTVEIRSTDTISGKPRCFTVSDAGIDTYTNEDDDDDANN